MPGRRLAPLAAAFLALACGREPEKSPAATARPAGGHSPAAEVLTTFAAPHCWTSELLAGVATPVSLLGAATDPHDGELLPSQIQSMAGARVLVLFGGDMDGWLAEPFRRNAPKAARTLEVLKLAGATPSASGAHDWLDASLAARLIEREAEALAPLLPKGAKTISENAGGLKSRLLALDAELMSLLSALPARRVFVVHPGLEPFANRYGLEIAGSYYRQVDREPTAADLDAFTKALKSTPRPVVLVGRGEMPGSLLRLANEVPFVTVTFDPIEAPDDSSASCYVERMRRNAMNIATALGAQSPAK